MKNQQIIDGDTSFGGDPTGQSECSIDALRRAMDRHGIEQACVYSQLAVRMDARQGNDEVLDLRQKDPRFHPVAVIDPRHARSGAGEVERCIATGVRLFRIFPKIHGYPCRYQPLEEVWQALERNGTALILPQDSPGFLTEFLTVMRDYRFPKILIGCQYWTFTEYLACLKKYPNTYLMAVAMNYPDAFETLVREIGARRICLGTNAPIYSMGASLMVVQHAELEEQDRAEILSGTLARLLGEEK